MVNPKLAIKLGELHALILHSWPVEPARIHDGIKARCPVFPESLINGWPNFEVTQRFINARDATCF